MKKDKSDDSESSSSSYESSDSDDIIPTMASKSKNDDMLGDS